METKTRDWARLAVLGFLFLFNLVYLIVSLVLTPEEPLLRIIICGSVGIKILFDLLPKINVPSFEIGKEVIRWKVWIEAGILSILILAAVFCFPETEAGVMVQRIQSGVGLVVFISGLCLTSHNFKIIPWRRVIPGILLQVLVGLFVMKTSIGIQLFQFISGRCMALLAFALDGSKFVFGDMAEKKVFAFIVLPVMLFFSSLINILYYLGVIQWVIGKFSWFFKVAMGAPGCESVVATAAPFIGMVESTLTIKPLFEVLTQSELHQILTSTLSTITGSVLIAFIDMGINSEAMITSCVMSIPCSLAISKIRYPESEVSQAQDQVKGIEQGEKEANLIHAAANGAAQGVHLCLMVGGSLLAVISLLSLCDSILGFFGTFVRIPSLSLSLIGGYIFIPFAWLVGVPWNESQKVGELMAIRLIANEFVAYQRLSLLTGKLSLRSNLLATYSLCGFANFCSIGILLSCIGGMAPSRKSDIAKLALSAVLTGTMCTFVSASIAGILI